MEMSHVISPWPLIQWKEGGGWLMFCCTLSVANGQLAGPPPGEKVTRWELVMDGKIGNSALEALHLETEASGRLSKGLAVCICLSLLSKFYKDFKWQESGYSVVVFFF